MPLDSIAAAAARDDGDWGFRSIMNLSSCVMN